VNTGVYVMEPEVLAEVPAGPGGGLVRSTSFPKLLDPRGAPLYGYRLRELPVEDVGTTESYLKVRGR